ncbi:hypothetical protein EDC14_101199 [Hydrogenispora ethanolica]|uniref:Uncharacterized protein n=1 Tax=Hydrogenispora ethanolica TaxID=1082276 RepID=A0A4V2QEZ7_HYDET|nr:hypothetical protein EDC14_101199 [Hydrogenispora ethanolica]
MIYPCLCNNLYMRPNLLYKNLFKNWYAPPLKNPEVFISL